MIEHNYKDMPKVKTVLDAVIYFDGEWPILISLGCDWYFYSLRCLSFSGEQVFFDKAEFEEYASWLASNMGIATQTYAEYKKGFRAIHQIDFGADKESREEYSPVIGETCLMNYPDIDNAWYEYTIDYIGKFVLVASCADVTERQAHIDDVHFKPLPKLENGKAYQFECGREVIGIYSAEDDAIITPWSMHDPARCTNIELLTVEGE